MTRPVVRGVHGRFYCIHGNDAAPDWACGQCGSGDLGPVPAVGDTCPGCGAEVIEAVDWDAVTAREAQWERIEEGRRTE